jgi:hypothetical protein
VRRPATVRPMTLLKRLAYLLVALIPVAVTLFLITVAGYTVTNPPSGLSPGGLVIALVVFAAAITIADHHPLLDLAIGGVALAVVIWGPESWAHNLGYVACWSILLAASFGAVASGSPSVENTTSAAPVVADRPIVGLSGYAGTGKDTAAAGLIWHGYTRVAVSDKIYELALRIDPTIHVPGATTASGLPLEVHTDRLSHIVAERGWTEAKLIPEVRKLLQDLGVAVRDLIDPDAWVKATMKDLPDGPLVFTSVRFPNEAQAIKDAGGIVLRVERPGVDASNAHITDTALDDWDFDGLLVNDGSEHDLGVATRQLVKLITENVKGTGGSYRETDRPHLDF